METTPFYRPPERLTPVKILVIGGPGAGKTTLVHTVSQIPPVNTDEHTTDPFDGPTMTVALDFGRTVLTGSLAMYLFGTPGHPRYWFMWEHLADRAAAAVVVASVENLQAAYPAVDFCETRNLSYVLALNRHHHAVGYTDSVLREALDVGGQTPITRCDVRDPESVRTVLLALAHHANLPPALSVHDGNPHAHKK